MVILWGHKTTRTACLNAHTKESSTKLLRGAVNLLIQVTAEILSKIMMCTSVIIRVCLPRSSVKGYRFAPKASQILRILLFALSPEKKTANTFFSTCTMIHKYIIGYNFWNWIVIEVSECNNKKMYCMMLKWNYVKSYILKEKKKKSDKVYSKFWPLK